MPGDEVPDCAASTNFQSFDLLKQDLQKLVTQDDIPIIKLCLKYSDTKDPKNFSEYVFSVYNNERIRELGFFPTHNDSTLTPMNIHVPFKTWLIMPQTDMASFHNFYYRFKTTNKSELCADSADYSVVQPIHKIAKFDISAHGTDTFYICMAGGLSVETVDISDPFNRSVFAFKNQRMH